MASRTINVLLSSFSGLDLPATLSLPIAASTPIADLTTQLLDRLDHIDSRFIITTTSNKQVSFSSLAPVSSLLSSDYDTFLPLRLSIPLCGGKGGFGSQLRAAGGRMSSRRKKNQGENNSSNRNLDGRRLRTVAEAKALAEYLALKPEMEKKEKEARRKRWEQVVDLAEKREQEIRNGSKGRVDGRWVEGKEEAGERTREAVVAAMKSGNYKDNLMNTSSGSSGGGSADASEGSEDDEFDDHSRKHNTPPFPSKPSSTPSRSYLGFDEDDEFMSDEDEHGEDREDGNDDVESHTSRDEDEKARAASMGKGKAIAL
ncbi:hypothetical protein MMC12_007446 [Toensbergia leucococca]|nr:hypothetical protein [Toensbergia leucococca]